MIYASIYQPFREYSSKCESVLECCVRSVVSSWAILFGLLSNNKETKKYLLNDIYRHLKRELNKFKNHINKYIILHDTTIDAKLGESVRMGFDMQKQSEEIGYPLNEINKGLWLVVEEFINENSNWTIKERFTNNNGLTILERIN